MFRLAIDAQGNATKVLVGNSGRAFIDIAMTSDGQLYGIQGNTLFRINKDTAAVTEVGPIGSSITGAGLSASPDGMLIGSAGNQVFRFDPNNPRNTTLIWTSPAGGQAAGDFLTVGNKMYVSWANGGTQLIELTLDASGKAISDRVLGRLDNNTFGLALGPNGEIFAAGNGVSKLQIPAERLPMVSA